jgi:hypothetical protein
MSIQQVSGRSVLILYFFAFMWKLVSNSIYFAVDVLLLWCYYRCNVSRRGVAWQDRVARNDIESFASMTTVLVSLSEANFYGDGDTQ